MELQQFRFLSNNFSNIKLYFNIKFDTNELVLPPDLNASDDMRYEYNRLKTFAYSKVKIFRSRVMALFGLYLNWEDEKIKCVFCNYTIENISEEIDMLDLSHGHITSNKPCPFIFNYYDQFTNFFMEPDGPDKFKNIKKYFHLNNDTDLYIFSPMMTFMFKPYHHNMSLFSDRVATISQFFVDRQLDNKGEMYIKNWSHFYSNKNALENIALEGVFYNKNSKKLTCFGCDFEADDHDFLTSSIYDAHHFFNRFCCFLLIRKVNKYGFSNSWSNNIDLSSICLVCKMYPCCLKNKNCVHILYCWRCRFATPPNCSQCNVENDLYIPAVLPPDNDNYLFKYFFRKYSAEYLMLEFLLEYEDV